MKKNTIYSYGAVLEEMKKNKIKRKRMYKTIYIDDENLSQIGYTTTKNKNTECYKDIFSSKTKLFEL